MNRFNSTFGDLDKWLTPQINLSLMPQHILTKKEWTVEIESQTNETSYGPTNSPISL